MFPKPALGYRHYEDPLALASDADFLVLTLPGGAQTHHIVNAERLALMKATAYFINTARHGIHNEADLYDALKVGLISVDSTMRSNLAVGLPLDLLILRRDAMESELTYRIEPGEPYFEDLRQRWSEALRATHQAIPNPPYTKKV